MRHPAARFADGAVVDGQISELARKAAVVFLTANKWVEIGLTALRLGARAIVHKRFAIEFLMRAIRAVADGLVWMPSTMQAALVAQDSPAAKKLTARESEIVRYVAIGMRNAEVTARHSLSETNGQNSSDRHFPEARHSRSN
jgi:DNA-binding NarL/FixJ family response regulator